MKFSELPAHLGPPAIKYAAPKHLLKPNPGIRVQLAIDVVSAAQVRARLTFTNLATEPIWLYKPLIGEGPWEAIFNVVADVSRRRALPYHGPHLERYENDNTQGLIFLYPRPGVENFLVLPPGATHVVEKNLAEVYTFLPGKYDVDYSVFMPIMQAGAHYHEINPVDGFNKTVYTNLISLPEGSPGGVTSIQDTLVLIEIA